MQEFFGLDPKELSQRVFDTESIETARGVYEQAGSPIQNLLGTLLVHDVSFSHDGKEFIIMTAGGVAIHGGWDILGDFPSTIRFMTQEWYRFIDLGYEEMDSSLVPLKGDAVRIVPTSSGKFGFIHSSERLKNDDGDYDGPPAPLYLSTCQSD